jgi:phosphoserine phosphatase
MAKKLIPLVIAYDFDGTLAPGNMQEYDFIPALKMQSKKFWAEVKKKAVEQDADEILAYMDTMLTNAASQKVQVRKSDFEDFGSKINLFPGVESWFKRINEYGKSKGVRIEHFIISSGLREMVEGTKIAKEFTKIYASGFMYDHHGVANWPAIAMNYTTKTQFLFRINKGSLDVHDNSVINKFVPQNKRPVPFENMIFIGDGETDIPCMRLVKDQGGYSIAVYRSSKKGAKDKATKLIDEGRVSLAAVANYSEGETIDCAVKAIVDKVEAASRILRVM